MLVNGSWLIQGPRYDPRIICYTFTNQIPYIRFPSGRPHSNRPSCPLPPRPGNYSPSQTPPVRRRFTLPVSLVSDPDTHIPRHLNSVEYPIVHPGRLPGPGSKPNGTSNNETHNLRSLLKPTWVLTSRPESSSRTLTPTPAPPTGGKEGQKREEG